MVRYKQRDYLKTLHTKDITKVLHQVQNFNYALKQFETDLYQTPCM